MLQSAVLARVLQPTEAGYTRRLVSYGAHVHNANTLPCNISHLLQTSNGKQGVLFATFHIGFMQSQAEEEDAGGCILAHDMGLGKSLQVVALLHTYHAYYVGKRSVLVVPVNVVHNWIDEFNTWLPTRDSANASELTRDKVWHSCTYRCHGIYVLMDVNSKQALCAMYMAWYENQALCLSLGLQTSYISAGPLAYVGASVTAQLFSHRSCPLGSAGVSFQSGVAAADFPFDLFLLPWCRCVSSNHLLMCTDGVACLVVC